jgi:hypothetical protein
VLMSVGTGFDRLQPRRLNDGRVSKTTKQALMQFSHHNKNQSHVNTLNQYMQYVSKGNMKMLESTPYRSLGLVLGQTTGPGLSIIISKSPGQDDSGPNSGFK